MEEEKSPIRKRNSFIELYRFVFALWVLYYHGYFFLPKNQFFDSGFLGVDFFFVLSGFFLLKAIVDATGFGFWKGMFSLVWKKLKPLGITLIISLIFAQIYFWIHVVDDFGDPFGFMWYIKWLVVVPVVYYTIFCALKKNKKHFLIAVGAIVVICYTLLHTVCLEWGVLRGFSGIGIGILLSQVPKLNLKFRKFDFSILVSAVLIVGTFLVAMYARYIPFHNHMFVLILFPALLYFANCIEDGHISVFNYLGSLSFGMYAYQTLNRLLEDFGCLNDKKDNVALFSIVMGLSILDNLVRRIVRHYKQNNIVKEEKSIEQK